MRSRAVAAVGLFIALIGLIGASATTRIVFALGVAIVIVGMMLLARDSRERLKVVDVGLLFMGALLLAWTLLVFVILSSLGL
jgi:hypothetical protein